MANDRLRSCIAAARLTVAEVSDRIGVDRKTVDRWISTGRLPHPRHRSEIAELLKTEPGSTERGLAAG